MISETQEYLLVICLKIFFVKFGFVDDCVVICYHVYDKCHQHFSNPGFSSAIQKKGDGWLYIKVT